MRLVIFAFAGTFSIACLSCDDSSCNGARQAMEAAIAGVCAEPDYQKTPFCQVCVQNNFFSIDNSCTCQPLTLNASECYYAQGTSATAGVQNAINQANAACQGRTEPILPCNYSDAAACAGGDGGGISAPDVDAPDVEAPPANDAALD